MRAATLRVAKADQNNDYSSFESESFSEHDDEDCDDCVSEQPKSSEENESLYNFNEPKIKISEKQRKTRLLQRMKDKKKAPEDENQSHLTDSDFSECLREALGNNQTADVEVPKSSSESEDENEKKNKELFNIGYAKMRKLSRQLTTEDHHSPVKKQESYQTTMGAINQVSGDEFFRMGTVRKQKFQRSTGKNSSATSNTILSQPSFTDRIQSKLDRTCGKIQDLGGGVISAEMINEFNNLIDVRTNQKIEDLTNTVKMQAGMVSAMQNVMESLVRKFQDQINLFDRNKIGYNFVFMFSSPAYRSLVTSVGEKQIPFAPLKYAQEYSIIKQTIKSSKIEITVHKVHGTEHNFRKILHDQKPGAIHFSGHGITAAEIRAENIRLKQFTQMSDERIDEIFFQGDALVLEDKNCLGQYIYANELKKMIQESGVKLDFVFMATCHSEFAAKIFQKAGAYHVIGIDQNEKIQDESILVFTQTFYAALWKDRSKICNCFEQAQRAVEINRGKEQAACFCIFVSKEHQEKKTCNHFGNFQLGKPKYVSDKALLWDTAPEVPVFQGYQRQKKQLIEEFFVRNSSQRFIRITGQAGVGKSALVQHTMNYVEERAFIDGGCIYVDGREIQLLRVFLKKLNHKIYNDRSGWLKSEREREIPDENYESLEKESQSDHTEEAKFFKILEALRNTEEDFVFFFDNVDLLVKEHTEFVTFIESLLDGCLTAKVVITTRECDRASHREKSIHLHGLDDPKQQAWDLFQEYSGRNISRQEKKAFVETLPDQNLFPELYDNGTQKKKVAIKYVIHRLWEHHFFQLLGWNPSAIILTALLWKGNANLTLAQLYKMITEQKVMHESKTMAGVSDALQLTVNVQVEELKRWDKGAYEFMQLLSFLPPLCSVKDLEKYWNEWKVVDNHQDLSKIQTIMTKLQAKGMIQTDNKSVEQQIQLTDSVKVGLSISWKEGKSNKVSMLLYKRQMHKMKQFYLNFKNESKERDQKEVMLEFKPTFLKLEEDDQNLIETLTRCFNYYHVDKKTSAGRRKLTIIDKSAMLSAQSLTIGNIKLSVTLFLKKMITMEKLGDAFRSKIIFYTMTILQEQFTLFTMVNMLLIGRYDFFSILMEKIGLNCTDVDCSKLDSLPVSKNFLGNFWRLGALFKYNESQQNKKTMRKKEFREIESRLEQAEEIFKEDNSRWGLGLVYNSLGRLYRHHKSTEIECRDQDFQKSQSYFRQAIMKFGEIDHFRGIYISLKDLHDLHQDKILESLACEDCDRYIDINTCLNYSFNHFRHLFQQQQIQNQNLDSENQLLRDICCADRQDLGDDIHVSLDLEIVLNDYNGSIGRKLLNSDEEINSGALLKDVISVTKNIEQVQSIEVESDLVPVRRAMSNIRAMTKSTLEEKSSLLTRRLTFKNSGKISPIFLNIDSVENIEKPTSEPIGDESTIVKPPSVSIASPYQSRMTSKMLRLVEQYKQQGTELQDEKPHISPMKSSRNQLDPPIQQTCHPDRELTTAPSLAATTPMFVGFQSPMIKQPVMTMFETTSNYKAGPNSTIKLLSDHIPHRTPQRPRTASKMTFVNTILNSPRSLSNLSPNVRRIQLDRRKNSAQVLVKNVATKTFQIRQPKKVVHRMMMTNFDLMQGTGKYV